MKSYRVLLVDDHEIFRGGLRSLLECHREYKIVGECVNGQEAVEKAVTLKPDVVIMYVTMPVMGGLEATRRILKDLPRTRVIVLTAHVSKTMAQQALKAGVFGCLEKSAASRVLLVALECMRQKRLSCPPEAQRGWCCSLREPLSGNWGIIGTSALDPAGAI